MVELFGILKELAAARFWGEVSVIFRNGKPTLFTKTEQTKLDHNIEVVSRNNHRDLIETPRGDHDSFGKISK